MFKAAGSDMAWFVEAPLLSFFIVGAFECVCPPLLGGEGGGGGRGGRRSWNWGQNAA